MKALIIFGIVLLMSIITILILIIRIKVLYLLDPYLYKWKDKRSARRNCRIYKRYRRKQLKNK